jgi:hypothetical protein
LSVVVKTLDKKFVFTIFKSGGNKILPFVSRIKEKERKRSLALIIALVWIMLWSGILFAIGYACLVQIKYFPMGTVFGLLSLALVITIFAYLTTRFILPSCNEFWKGKEKEEEK